MARHAARHRVDRITDVDTLLLEHLGHLRQRVLRLRDRHAVARHDDHAVCLLHDEGGVLGRTLAHCSIAQVFHSGRRGLSAEPAENDADERPVHSAAHDVAQDRARRADERARDDQQRVRKREPDARGGPSGVGVQHRDHDRHVGATDRHDNKDADDK